MALTNSRLLAAGDQQATFQYKDYRSHQRQKSRRMTVTTHEFIRRFLLHVLPSGFQRFRHYGLPGSRRKKTLLRLCRQLPGAIPTQQARTAPRSAAA